ncbi:MAG: protein kinase [Planctomycetes bacterium]|nr:protein kinase [Planctomycetota bacterium]
MLTRAIQYQRAHEPSKRLGEILLEKRILSREQVDDVLAYQSRIRQLTSQTGSHGPQHQQPQQGFPPDSGRMPMATGISQGPPMLLNETASSPAIPPMHNAGTGYYPGPNNYSTPNYSTPNYSTPSYSTPNYSTPSYSPAPGSYPPAGFSTPGSEPGGVPRATAKLAAPRPDGEEADHLIGMRIAGCLINDKIGQGGMGAIYKAHHEALRKEVVVKILPPDSAANPRTVERFFREARAAARLEHPNIVQVQDVGTTDRGLHYIVMQFIEGQNLEEKMQAEGRQEPQNAVRIVKQVALGLRVAHAAGVIHRDIKAENILIDMTQTVKLTDFGLAKDLNSELKLTADGAMIGTPLYMAPEIGRVKEIDGRVDIYSLGVTFYYLLTGVQPFRGFSALEILSAKAHDKLKPPEQYFPEIATRYRNVLGKMLEKDRDNRYPDIDALVTDLEALERDLPLDLPEPSIWPSAGQRGATERLGPEVSDKVRQTTRRKPAKRASSAERRARSPHGSESNSNTLLLVIASVLLLGVSAVILFVFLT